MPAVTQRLADIASAEWASELAVRHSYAVEAWKATVYWGPWTAADYDAVFGPGAPRAQYARSVRVIVAKATDKDGKPLFVAPEEDQLLRTARPSLITALAAEIVKTMPKVEDAKDAEKNSEAIQT
jgi:hypothetical protein